MPEHPKLPEKLLVIDLFCRVIDNFGDAGVCLRLARAFVMQHGFAVRLWCDDLALLHRMQPVPVLNLSFHAWAEHAAANPADGVICGFGCTLDDTYLQAMATCKPQPAYIHLEYLSAEPWVENTHGLWSTHPRLGLKQRFCNPGFAAGTAGLLHETPALTDGQALQTLSQYGEVPASARRVFVFGYATAAFNQFVADAIHATCAVHWVLPQGAAGQALRAALQGRAGHTFTQLPFVSQTQFDAALRSCHAAWVRGEDSAVTAMFTGIPMLWQLYPQDDGAHTVKAQALVDTVGKALPAHDLSAWQTAIKACNGADTAQHLQAIRPLQYLLHQDEMAFRFAALWAQHCRASVPDIASTLAHWLREWKIP